MPNGVLRQAAITIIIRNAKRVKGYYGREFSWRISFSPIIRLKFIMFDTDHIDPRWEEGRDYQMVCGWDDPLNYCERDISLNRSKSNRFLPWRVASNEIGAVPVEQGDLCLFLVGADIEQDIPGEWVLMEFLGDEWFAASVGTCSRSYRQVNVESMQEGQKRWRQNRPEDYHKVLENLVSSGRKWIEENKELHRQLAAEGRRKFARDNPDRERERAEKATQGLRKKRQEMSEEERSEYYGKISCTLKKYFEENPDAKAQLKENSAKMHSQKWQCTVTGHITTPGPLTLYQRKRGIDPANRIRLN